MSDQEENKKVPAEKNGNRSIFKRAADALASKLSDLRGEFRKIVWPSREVLLKHTVTTIVISLIFGAFITLLDALFGVAFTSLVGLMGSAG